MNSFCRDIWSGLYSRSARDAKINKTKGIYCFILILFTVVQALPVLGGNPDGDLEIEIITAVNLVVESNIKSETSNSPRAFYIGARFCNRGSNDIEDVMAYVGDYTAGTPGIYPVDVVDEAAAGYSYAGDFKLQHEASQADATRYLGTIPGDSCIVVYWLVSYPRLDANGNSVTGSNSTDDDLQLQFDVWVTANDAGSHLAANTSNTVICRSELAAAANKIWPSNTNKVPEEFLSVVNDSIGWHSNYEGGQVSACPGGANMELRGIWYDLGNINQGFDNDGDNVPDYNVWLQPVGNPALFNADCYRLVRTYGMMIISLKGNGYHIIQFEDELYHTNIPPNTGGVGFVVYEFVIVNGPCSSRMTPYQEVASGKNNEKYNGDFGAGEDLSSSEGPCASIEKTVSPAQITSLPSNLTYTIDYINQSSSAIGQPQYHLPLIISDSIPAYTSYVSGSAASSNTLPTGVSGYTIRYSTDHGNTWQNTEPTPASSVTNIEWWLNDVMPANGTGQVNFQVTVDPAIPNLSISNTANLSFGNSIPFAEDSALAQLTGPNSIQGLVWADDGGTTGAEWNLTQDGDEVGISSISISLYLDANGNQIIDESDILWRNAESTVGGNFTFNNLLDGSYIVVVDEYDSDLPDGYVETTQTLYSINIDVSGTSSSGISESGFEFGFGPPLLVNKRLVSSNPSYEGDTISFSINVANRSNLPLAVIPLSDTFDVDKLEYLYALPNPTSFTSGLSSPYTNTGIIAWNNIGSISGSEAVVYSEQLPQKNNLIGFWTFNEGSGNTASDVSGNEHHGNLQNSPDWITGYYGAGLDFNSAYVEVPHDAQFNTNTLTIAAWVNVDVMGDYKSILTKGITTSPYAMQLGWPVTNGNFFDDNFRLSLNQGLAGTNQGESTGEFMPGEWHHIATTYDGDTAKFYIDGVFDSYVVLNTTITFNSESLILGADMPGGTEYFDGKIDEVALYNIALSDAEVSELMLYNSLQQELDAIALNWPIEEGSGLSIQDATGKGTTGSLINSPSWTIGNVGSFGLGFDGIDDHVMSTDLDATFGDKFAMSFWVNTSSSGSNQYMISHDQQGSSTNGEWAIKANSSGLLVLDFTQGGIVQSLAAGSGAINDGIWHHVTVNYNGTNLSMFKDGTQVYSSPESINLPQLNAPAWLAKDVVSDTDHFTGNLDHIYLFTDSLSSDEILELYQSFYPSYFPQEGSCPSLVGEWNFEEGTGLTVRDESGNAITGTLQNSPNWIDGQSGRHGLDFSGSSLEHIDYGSTDVNLGSTFSIGFWLKSTGTDYLEVIMAKGNQGSPGHFQVYLNYGELYIRTDAPGTIDQTSGYLFNDDLWHHVLINYNGSAYIFYVDGNPVSSVAQDIVLPATTAPFMVGKRPDVSINEFNGQLDHLMIFNCALNENEIERLLETGSIEDLETQEVKVYFLAKDPGVELEGTTNSVCVSGALFTDGRAANQGCDVDLANVTIINTGSIGGMVWNDIDGDGWQGSNGFESGENGLSGIRVILESCSNVNSGTCTTTIERDTVFTDDNGTYEFTGLFKNYYYRTYVVQADIPDSSPTQTGDPDDDPARGSGNGGTCGTGTGDAACDDYWNNDGAWFQMLADTWGGENENLNTINFGYQITGAIFGEIWEDLNENGLKDSFEPPIQNVTVNLSNGNTTSTDVNGRYTFQDLTPSTYTVSVDLASLPITSSWIQTGESDLSINNSISSTITLGLADGSHDFGFSSSGFSIIGDQLYYDWDGDGTQDLNEEGIANITIWLYKDIDENSLKGPEDVLFQTTTTDADGYYTFSNLAEGYYIIGIDESDSDFPIASQTGDPDEVGACLNCDGWGAEWVDGFWIYFDEDFGYKPLGIATVGDLVWRDANGDQNQAGIQETGIENINITLKVDLNQDGTYEEIRTEATNNQGNYSFNNLPNGNYEIFVDSTSSNLPIGASGHSYSLSIKGVYKFTISNGSVSMIDGNACSTCNLDFDFGFYQLGLIGDIIFWDNNGNGTQDLHENGIPNVTVYACQGEVNTCNFSNAISTTVTADGSGAKAAGYYEFQQLSAGTYTIAVETTTGVLSTTIQTADPDIDGLACNDPARVLLGYAPCDNHFDWTLGTGELYSGADFGYQPTGVIGDYIWFDQNGDGLQDDTEVGIENLTIYLCPGTSTCDGSSAIDTLYSDENGAYSFAEVTDGTYTVSVVPPSSFSPSSGSQSVGSNSVVIIMSGAAISSIGGTACSSCDLDVDFGYELAGSYSISGNICLDDNSEDGLCTGLSGEIPIDSNYVYLHNDDGLFLGSSLLDVNGAYQFKNLANDTYILSLNTEFQPLDIADLTTDNGDVPIGATLTESTSAVSQTIPISGASINDADFAFTITEDLDFGDLPFPYATQKGISPQGAYHTVPSSPSLYLGSNIDAETDGFLSAIANGDDNDSSDDEDGVKFIDEYAWTEGLASTGNGGTVEVTVTGNGWLVAWIDFNKDGDFGDPNELIINQAVSTGTASYNFDIPSDTDVSGDTFSRFRLFQNKPAVPNFAYYGLSTNGEVEDHHIAIYLLPVELRSFEAKLEGENTFLQWSVSNETDIREYELQRSSTGNFFESIYKRDAKNEGSAIENYAFLDQKVLKLGEDHLFYRLKYTDIAGEVRFSDMVEVVIGESNFAFLNVYPIPAIDFFQLQYSLHGFKGTHIKIINGVGQTVYLQKIEDKKGIQQVEIDASRWARGYYYAQLNYDQGRRIVKFILK